MDGTMLVVGSMIGSGIFIVSSDMVRQLGSAGWLIAMWVLTGTITVIAAVSYGELSAMFPKAGGQYILRRHMENSLVFYTVGVSLP
jgi:APA family basic amino acid/polyamine antiporter